MVNSRTNRVLVTGYTGQVGRELAKIVPPEYELVLASDGTARLDLTDLKKLSAFVRNVRPAVILHPAAYTAVDKAESEPDQAQILNATVPEVLATEAKAINALLVHYSTDYVFSGDPGHPPWTEEDAPAPLNVYGASKLAGENAVRSIHDNHLIFRTSWVYGCHGHNFMKTMLRLAQERDQINVVNDQIGAPTPAALLARLTYAALQAVKGDRSICGLYHLTSSGSTSWHGFAREIIGRAKSFGLPIKCNVIEPIPSTAFPTPAKRPLNSVLNCDKFVRNFSLRPDKWEIGLADTLKEYITPTNK